MSVDAFYVPPGQQGILKSRTAPLQMALNRREVTTKFIDAKKAKFLTFAGVKDALGNQYKTFAYGHRPVIDTDVARPDRPFRPGKCPQATISRALPRAPVNSFPEVQ